MSKSKAYAFGIYSAAVALGFGCMGVFDWTSGHISESYKPTTGKVISLDFSLDFLSAGGSKYSSKPHLRYYVKMLYSYEVDGKQFQSDRISYPSPWSMTPEEVDKFKTKHPEGSDLTVYYDPKNPSHSSLRNSVETSLLVVPICWFIFPGLLSLLCFLIASTYPAGIEAPVKLQTSIQPDAPDIPERSEQS